MNRLNTTLIFSIVLILMIVSCSNNNSNSKKMEAKKNNTEEAIFPKGEVGSSDWFTGEVYVQGLYSVGSVTFEAGGKTHWHTHPIGQVLLVTEGKGWYQERGKTAQALTKGSVIIIPKNVEHWHGAASDNKLVHIAISNMKEGSNVAWMAPVNDDEYSSVNN